MKAGIALFVVVLVVAGLGALVIVPVSIAPAELAKTRLLFLCTGNSCRSQMAEGWTRELHGDTFDVYSAGTDPHGLNPRAVEVMREAGVDISRHRSKTIAELPMEFDVVVTVCDHAADNCPALPGAPRMIHVSFDDPPKLAEGAASDDEALAPYRRVRDEIRDFVAALPERLDLPPSSR